MRILFTGASSFSGFWFVKELVEAGHDLTLIIRKPLSEYQGTRRERIETLLDRASVHFEISYGDPSFFKLIQAHSFDLFCTILLASRSIQLQKSRFQSYSCFKY